MTGPQNDGQINSFFDLLGRYKKATITLATSLLIWGNGVSESAASAPTAKEWIGLGLAVVGTGVVAAVTNKQ